MGRRERASSCPSLAVLSPAEPDVSYADINFKTASTPRVRTDRGAHKQELKPSIGTRPHRKIRLFCLVTFGLVTFGLVATVVGLSIYVSQYRQSLITSERSYRRLWDEHKEMNNTQLHCQQQVHKLNSTLVSKTTDNSRLNLSWRNCLKNLSELNKDQSNLENNISVLSYNLSELNQAHIDLRLKYRNTTERNAQICQYLTSKAEQTCPQRWIKNADRCYFTSNLEKSFDGAREHCSNLDARLLEINSNQEEDFVSISVAHRFVTYWIGKCRDGNVRSFLLYKMFYKWSTCRECNLHSWGYSCNRTHRFICEKSAHLYRDVPEEIRGLCQQTVGRPSVD